MPLLHPVIAEYKVYNDEQFQESGLSAFNN